MREPAQAPKWLVEHRTWVALLRLLRRNLGVTHGERWPPWMLITTDDVMADLPFTPPCRHLQPHPPRVIETESELIDYLVFKQLGWEQGGYCWSYVPAYLQEWFGRGPDQPATIHDS